MNRRGFTTLEVLAVVAVVGVVLVWLKPKLGSGKHDAQASVAATAAVVQTVDAQGASAAAGVVAIGTANSMAADSPSKSFIAREVPSVLSKLPAPDPVALLEAEKRRAAVMEGRLEEASKLYEREAKRAEKLQQERDTAIAERQAVDVRLSEAAAAREAAQRQSLIFKAGMAAVGLLAAAIWFYRVSPTSLGRIVADIRAGVPATAAFDAHTSPLLQKHINRAARLATPSE
jgi:prepilin-type N-terminal cleavage/methylation domain-containing protein